MTLAQARGLFTGDVWATQVTGIVDEPGTPADGWCCTVRCWRPDHFTFVPKAVILLLIEEMRSCRGCGKRNRVRSPASRSL